MGAPTDTDRNTGRLARTHSSLKAVWHECSGCNALWPFPEGYIPTAVDKANGWRDNREFVCSTCKQAAWAKGTRNFVPLLKRYLQNHCENSDCEGTSVLCECKLCNETRVAVSLPVW